jgi:glycosyltransferase involved in cell wall biosynthesis
MACGTPVVVTDRGALPEVVGDAGVVVGLDGIAGGLRRVLTDPSLAADLARRGPARAATMTWSRTAELWLGALQRAGG